MPIENLSLVTNENFHNVVPEYIKSNNIIISDYNDMMNVILTMIRGKYFFNMDKDLLRGFIEDLTYMYCPGDDINKDRIIAMLEPESDDSDDEDEELVMEEMDPTPPKIQNLVDNSVSDSDY